MHLFHCRIGLMVRDSLIRNHPHSIRVYPIRRIELLDRHILESDREVDQIEINVVKTKIGQRLLQSDFNMLGTVECVPKLRSDE